MPGLDYRVEDIVAEACDDFADGCDHGDGLAIFDGQCMECGEVVRPVRGR